MIKRFIAAVLLFLVGIGFALAAVNINTASIEELDSVKGIGPAKAKAIIEYRTKNGPFKSVDDLVNVPGFGQKSLEKMRPELTVGGSSGASSAPAAPAKVPGKK